MSIISAPPTRVPPLSGLPNPFAREWRNYLQDLQNVGQASPQILPETTKAAQTAAIATTPLPLPGISAGYYRVSVYQLITAPAVTSSSLQVTIGWTDQSLAVSRQLAAITSNTLAASDGIAFPIHVDNASPITYAVAYASNGANQMTYNIGILIEQMA
jgi:hypothetical protein